MRVLTIESTCDETAAAVVDDSLVVHGSAVASQDELHEQFRGVVPEIAARAHVERILPVIDHALRQAECRLADIDAFAVANRPGLVGSLLVGVVAAKTLALATGKPLIAINHLHAHIYACQIDAGRNVFPCIGLVVSGGHSSLYHCATPLDFRILGGTIDDAAGEAFDKVANMLRLPYPGGPSLSKAALAGDPQAYPFPRSFIREKEVFKFSFSGLKTAVRYQIAKPGERLDEAELPPQKVADLAASFQEAVVDCLVAKSMSAMEATRLERLCVGGGVAANGRLRNRLTTECEKRGYDLVIAPIALCTDNAVMGAIAVERYRAGLFEEFDLDAYPGLVRDYT